MSEKKWMHFFLATFQLSPWTWP